MRSGTTRERILNEVRRHMDANLKQEILRTIVLNENRMSTRDLAYTLTKAGYKIVTKDLLELENNQTLACVDGNWIVQRWWEVNSGRHA